MSVFFSPSRKAQSLTPNLSARHGDPTGSGAQRLPCLHSCVGRPSFHAPTGLCRGPHRTHQPSNGTPLSRLHECNLRRFEELACSRWSLSPSLEVSSSALLLVPPFHAVHTVLEYTTHYAALAISIRYLGPHNNQMCTFVPRC